MAGGMKITSTDPARQAFLDQLSVMVEGVQSGSIVLTETETVSATADLIAGQLSANINLNVQVDPTTEV